MKWWKDMRRYWTKEDSQKRIQKLNKLKIKIRSQKILKQGDNLTKKTLSKNNQILHFLKSSNNRQKEN